MTVAVVKFTNAVKSSMNNHYYSARVLYFFLEHVYYLLYCCDCQLYTSISHFESSTTKLWLPLLLLLLFFSYISTFQMMPTVHSKVIVILSRTPSTVHNLVHLKCHLHIWKHLSGWLQPWIYKIVLHHLGFLFIWLKRIATYIITMNPSTAASLWKFFPSFLSYSFSECTPKTHNFSKELWARWLPFSNLSKRNLTEPIHTTKAKPWDHTISYQFPSMPFGLHPDCSYCRTLSLSQSQQDAFSLHEPHHSLLRTLK